MNRKKKIEIKIEIKRSEKKWKQMEGKKSKLTISKRESFETLSLSLREARLHFKIFVTQPIAEQV